MRTIRNTFIHSEGIDFGAIEWQPVFDAPLRGLSGVWLFRSQIPDQRLRGGLACRPFEALAEAAQSRDQEFVVLTFKTIVDSLWQAIASVTTRGLCGLAWSPASWVIDDAVDTERLQLTRWWRTRLQRRLWGISSTG
jgi:hypothetical protein